MATAASSQSVKFFIVA